MSYYTVVTFGATRSEYPAFRRSLQAAIKDAESAVGSGTCSGARVYECDTLQLAKTADISTVRSGERIAHVV